MSQDQTTIPDGWVIATVSDFDTRNASPALGDARRKGCAVQLLSTEAVVPIVRGEAASVEEALAVAIAKAKQVDALT